MIKILDYFFRIIIYYVLEKKYFKMENYFEKFIFNLILLKTVQLVIFYSFYDWLNHF